MEICQEKKQHCEERRDPPQQRVSEWTGAPLEFQIQWHNFATSEKCGKFSFRRLRIAKKLSQWINACRRGFSSYCHFSGLDGMWGGILVQQRVAADLCVYLSLYPRGSSSLHTPLDGFCNGLDDSRCNHQQLSRRRSPLAAQLALPCKAERPWLPQLHVTSTIPATLRPIAVVTGEELTSAGGWCHVGYRWKVSFRLQTWAKEALYNGKCLLFWLTHSRGHGVFSDSRLSPAFSWLDFGPEPLLVILNVF